MQKLIKGALTFRRHVFAAYRDLFAKLAQGQAPEALFITCSDSRVVPSLITATDPGDLFVVRNVGNIVPPHAPGSPRENPGAAALEYAIQVLNVRHIIVCGHSGCGAMKAALSANNDSLPHAMAWLSHVDQAKQLLQPYEPFPDEQTRADMLSELNVLTQIKHIKSYPFVLERIESGDLHLSAWFFEIDSAQVYTYSPDEEQFVPLTEQSAASMLTGPAPGANGARVSPPA
ncbi:MAG: carbonic anhydrase [Polyangia bacterium]